MKTFTLFLSLRSPYFWALPRQLKAEHLLWCPHWPLVSSFRVWLPGSRVFRDLVTHHMKSHFLALRSYLPQFCPSLILASRGPGLLVVLYAYPYLSGLTRFYSSGKFTSVFLLHPKSLPHQIVLVQFQLICTLCMNSLWPSQPEVNNFLLKICSIFAFHSLETFTTPFLGPFLFMFIFLVQSSHDPRGQSSSLLHVICLSDNNDEIITKKK